MKTKGKLDKIEGKLGKNRTQYFYCGGKRISRNLAAVLLRFDVGHELDEIIYEQCPASINEHPTVMVAVDVMRYVPEKDSSAISKCGFGYSFSVPVADIDSAIRFMQCAKDKIAGFEYAKAYDLHAWLGRATTPLIPLAFIYKHWANARRTTSNEEE